MYDWTKWLDHVTDPSDRYTMVDNGDGTFTIARAGTVMQQGTPQDQVRFNNIEDGIVDAHLAVDLMLNYARQNEWEVEIGTKALTNSEAFPFNNSIQTISLVKRRENADYIVIVEVPSHVSNIGDIVISDKLINGFKIAYTGSASAVTVKYTVLGGKMK